MDPSHADGLAPTFPVPILSIVSVEHPCVVQHADRAIGMLGGSKSIARCVEADAKATLGLKFKPQDPASRTIISINKPTNNLLLKIRMPRRTGRKRKRGSEDPYVEDPDSLHCPKDARYLTRCMRDNNSSYRVDIIGNITSTHLWRAIPDFIYSTKGSDFFGDLKDKIAAQDYPTIQKWSLSKTYGLADTEVFPPPVLSTITLPTNYTYRQNPAVRTVADPKTGKATLHNMQAPQRLYTHQVQHDDPVWPQQVHPRATPLHLQPANLQKIVREMETLFEERPIWSRRALLNQLPDNAPFFLARYAVTYIAFAVRSGPWRDTLIKLGVDPRRDRSYRKFQSVLIQLVSKDPELSETRDDYARSWARSKDKRSHIFSGQHGIPPDGKVWQLCDLDDPQLKGLVDCPEGYLREQCETRYFGWYGNGTIAKIRVALKAKTDAFRTGEALDHAALENFLKLPEHWPHGNQGLGDPDTGYLPKTTTKKELEWASAYRSLCRNIDRPTPVNPGGGRTLDQRKSSSVRLVMEDPDDGLSTTTPGDQDPVAGYEEPENGDAGLSDQEDNRGGIAESPIHLPMGEAEGDPDVSVARTEQPN